LICLNRATAATGAAGSGARRVPSRAPREDGDGQDEDATINPALTWSPCRPSERGCPRWLGRNRLACPPPKVVRLGHVLLPQRCQRSLTVQFLEGRNTLMRFITSGDARRSPPKGYGHSCRRHRFAAEHRTHHDVVGTKRCTDEYRCVDAAMTFDRRQQADAIDAVISTHQMVNLALQSAPCGQQGLAGRAASMFELTALKIL